MKKHSAYSLTQSFGFALRGIFYALTRERNLRIHFTAGAYVLYFSRYYDPPAATLGLLILCIGFVVVCEMFNTAIETTVDLETSHYHTLAKIAKDVAAGAVLVSAATSVVVGFLLFWDIPTIQLILADIFARPIPFLIVFIVAVGWIFLPQKAK